MPNKLLNKAWKLSFLILYISINVTGRKIRPKTKNDIDPPFKKNKNAQIINIPFKNGHKKLSFISVTPLTL